MALRPLVYVTVIPSYDLALARVVMKFFSEHGCQVTLDWTQGVEAAEKWYPQELGLRATLRQRGIEKADVVVVVLSELRQAPGSCVLLQGSGQVDLGIAIGMNRPVVLVTRGLSSDRMFFSHPSIVRVKSVEQSLPHLMPWYEQKRRADKALSVVRWLTRHGDGKVAAMCRDVLREEDLGEDFGGDEQEQDV